MNEKRYGMILIVSGPSAAISSDTQYPERLAWLKNMRCYRRKV